LPGYTPSPARHLKGYSEASALARRNAPRSAAINSVERGSGRDAQLSQQVLFPLAAQALVPEAGPPRDRSQVRVSRMVSASGRRVSPAAGARDTSTSLAPSHGRGDPQRHAHPRIHPGRQQPGGRHPLQDRLRGAGLGHALPQQPTERSGLTRHVEHSAQSLPVTIGDPPAQVPDVDELHGIRRGQWANRSVGSCGPTMSPGRTMRLRSPNASVTIASAADDLGIVGGHVYHSVTVPVSQGAQVTRSVADDRLGLRATPEIFK
jgi:hypothetical protein